MSGCPAMKGAQDTEAGTAAISTPSPRPDSLPTPLCPVLLPHCFSPALRSLAPEQWQNLLLVAPW